MARQENITCSKETCQDISIAIRMVSVKVPLCHLSVAEMQTFPKDMYAVKNKQTLSSSFTSV